LLPEDELLLSLSEELPLDPEDWAFFSAFLGGGDAFLGDTDLLGLSLLSSL